MRVAHALMVVALLSGCSMLKKKTEVNTLTEHTDRAQVSAYHMDSTRRITTERWKLSIPSSARAVTPDFQPDLLSRLSNLTAEQKAAFITLQSHINNVNTARAKTWIVEYEHTLNEGRLNLKQDTRVDSMGTKQLQSSQLQQKDYRLPWYLYLIAGLALLLLLFRNIKR